MTSSETSPKHDTAISANDDFTHETDDFDIALHEYGRSIFESAMDDFHDEDHSHENRIFENEQKVRALYSSASDEFKSQMAVLQDEKRVVEDRNSKLEIEISRLRQSLQDQEVSSREACQELAAEAWEHEASKNREARKRQRLEAEWSGMEQDKRRKAESKAEIWERLEKRRAE